MKVGNVAADFEYTCQQEYYDRVTNHYCTSSLR